MGPQTDTLDFPAFLDRRGTGTRLPRARRWARMTPRPRPEGERWEQAERWEVFISQDVPNIAVGLRRVWVVEGRKWARLHDGQLQAKIPMAQWRQMQRNAKQVA